MNPHLVGVAPLGLELGGLNHSPGSVRAQWETLFVEGAACVGSCGLQLPHQLECTKNPHQKLEVHRQSNITHRAETQPHRSNQIQILVVALDRPPPR